MAHYQSKHLEEARAALARCIEISKTKLPRLDSGDLGINWHDCLIAHILLREAHSIIEWQVGTRIRKVSEISRILDGCDICQLN